MPSRTAPFDPPTRGVSDKPAPPLSPREVNGTGVIDRVTYEDITVRGALLWTVFVTTQQQAQPGGGTNTGCSFLFPLPGAKCPPVAQVPVTNLVIRNLVSTGALLSPGVLQCAEAGPCTGWAFENVSIESGTGWPMGGDVLYCAGIEGATWINSTDCSSVRPSRAPKVL